MLNILNWSPVENLVDTRPSAATENESKAKGTLSAVPLSIELQKKMLK